MSFETYENPPASAPAFVVLLGLSAAIFAGSSGCGFFISAVIAPLTACAWILGGTGRLVPRWLEASVLILFLTLLLSLTALYRLGRAAALPAQISVSAKVLSGRQCGKKRALLLGTPYGRLGAYLPFRLAPAAGSVVSIRGAVFDFQRAKKEGGFDEFYFWRAKGAVKKVVLLECAEIKKPEGPLFWRNIAERRIRNALPERTADYLLALTLGVRSAELTELHRNAGTLHLLAISGFHVAALASLAGLFFRRGRAKLLGVSAVVWGFVLLSGASPGGLRAAVALQIYLFSLQFGRTCRAFNSVSLAGVLLLLVNPWYFFDPGWRLSMLAALFLSAFAQTLKDSSPAALAASSPLVWLVTAAQTAFVFGAVPLAGLFINVLAVPLFAVIFPLILALSLPALAGVPCGAYAAGACEYILEAWDWAAGAAAGLIPWDISCSRQLFVLSSAVFCMAVLRASGFSKIKTTVGAFLLPFLLLLSA